MKPPDVSSSEIAPHPGEVTHCLSRAMLLLGDLERAATARGDDAGALAWREAAALVAQAVEEVGAARSRQNWAARRTEPCPTCQRAP